MISIYASKMFKSSKHQEKVLASLGAFENAELVKQLEEYLDDEYKPMGDCKPSESDDMSSDNAVNHGKPESSNPSPIRPVSKKSNLSSKISDLDSELNPDSEDDSDTAPDTAVEDSSIDSSSVTSQKSVTANTALQNPLIVTQNLYSSLVDELKGTLNARSETSGVARIAIKSEELWIYYNDNVNLNSMMPNVIDVLNAANYYYLVFNRLARTDNAIVFDLTTTDTNNSVDGVQND